MKKSPKRTFALLFTALALLGGIGVYQLKKKPSSRMLPYLQVEKIDEENWVEFTPSSGDFSIQFPKPPLLTVRDFTIPKTPYVLPYHDYSCEEKGMEEGRTYSISYVTLPKEWLNWSDKLLLKFTLQTILSEYNHEIIGKSGNLLKGFHSLDYAYRNGDRGTSGTLVLVEGTLYKIELSYPLHEHAAMENKAARFIHSFTPKRALPEE